MTADATSFPCVVEEIHGVAVRDPFRWLEDRALPETKAWVERQGAASEAYFSNCDNLAWFRERVRGFLELEVVDQPARSGERLFYRRRRSKEEQGRIYVRNNQTNEVRLLVDPSSEGDSASVGIHFVSEDSSLLAYEVRHGGEDRKQIRIVEVDNGYIRPDRIPRGCARGFAFAERNRGFYYCHEFSRKSPEQSIQFHSFSQVPNRTIFRRTRTRASQLSLIADDVHLGAKWTYECGHQFLSDFFMASRDRDEEWWPVFLKRTLPCNPVLYRGRIFVFCREGAPNGKIIELALDGSELRVVVPESSVPSRQSVAACDKFYISSYEQGRSSIHSRTLEGLDGGEIDVPIEGTSSLLPSIGVQQRSIFYVHESFAQRPAIYEYWPKAGKSCPWSDDGVSHRAYECQVSLRSFSSSDGTRIPITLVSRICLADSVPKPVIMTSYGGFGTSMTPRFSVLITIMTTLGAVFALPHIRGGGDFGRAWHDAGRARDDR
jgi:prolyl oligopeptidase